MNQKESCVILTKQNKNGNATNTCRLIKTADTLSCGWIYSVFISTKKNNKTDEEFAYDIARNEEDARSIFRELCDGGVTADVLHDTLHKLIADPLILP